MRQFVQKFLETESSSSTVLMVASALALIAANIPDAAYYYEALRGHTPTLIINDGLMALFFLVIGIEIKHEMKEGSLSTRSQALLPALAALGGVIVPALIYTIFNWDTPLMIGWAIPAATDIAFSLGVLSFFGRRLPASLRIFLMAVAVIDDLIAIVIIATFYTSSLNLLALIFAIGCIGLLYIYNRQGVSRMTPYLLLGGALWAALLESGVHPTIGGVALGLLMPMPMGKKLVEILNKWVAFGVIPLFAFVNAGVPLSGLSMGDITHPVTLGIMLGLIIGKPLGIIGVTAALQALKMAALPPDSNWKQFTGIAMMAGIGFTMSLFIGTLAFGNDILMLYTRLGVIAGSVVSALAGTVYLVVSVGTKKGPA